MLYKKWIFYLHNMDIRMYWEKFIKKSIKLPKIGLLEVLTKGTVRVILFVVTRNGEMVELV